MSDKRICLSRSKIVATSPLALKGIVKKDKQ